MEPLIKFRLSIDKLNEKEFSTFANKWMTLLNREIITSLIFNYFYKNTSISDNNNAFNLSAMMDDIANIINKRKKDKTKQISSNSIAIANPLKLNRLPSELIGEISSFLETTDHTHFEQLSRQVYISCNNPSRLVWLKIHPRLTRHPPNFVAIRNKYPLLTMFTTYAMYLTKRVNRTHIQPFHHLHRLALFFSNITTEEYKCMQNSRLCNAQNLTHLTLQWYPRDLLTHTDPMNIHSFLAPFINLESLYLNNVHVNLDQFNDMKSGRILTKLKHFRADNHRSSVLIPEVNAFVAFYSDQLETLRVFHRLQINSEKGFAKLKQLSVVAPSMQTMNNILNTTKILEQFQLRFVRNTSLSDEELRTLAFGMLKTQPLLKLVRCDVGSNDWNFIVNVLTNVLSECAANMSKVELRIMIGVCNARQINMTETKTLIEKLLKALNALVSEDFMLKIIFSNRTETENVLLDNEEIATEMIKSLNERFICAYSTMQRRQNENMAKHTFIIVNKGCKICGYNDRWNV